MGGSLPMGLGLCDMNSQRMRLRQRQRLSERGFIDLPGRGAKSKGGRMELESCQWSKIKVKSDSLLHGAVGSKSLPVSL